MKKKSLKHDYIIKATDELVPYARNSRTHSPEQIAQLCASITEFGFTNPVLIDETGLIIAGHGRVTAAQKLKITEIPCVVLRGLTETQKRAYVIADNKLALNAGWDDEMLFNEIRGLMDDNFSLDLLGFDEESIAAILREASPIEMPNLDASETKEFQQMTFILSNEQAEQVKTAIDKAKGLGAFVETGNENSNGNALARVCEIFNGGGK
jgi:ParB-like chromosome segregation protein Spo0J